MRRKLASLLAAAVLSTFGIVPAWAQAPISAALGLPPATPPAAKAVTAPACDIAGCPEDCASGYFSAGLGFYLMTPFFSNNATGVFTEVGNKSGGVNVAQQNFSQHIDAAPLAWLAYTWENGWGVRARWFDFVGDTTATASFDPTVFTFSSILDVPLEAPGEKFISTRSLHLDVIDLEATNNFVWGKWALLGSIGVRYAHLAIAQTQIATFEGETFFNASSSSTFSGVGPTIALEARRRIADSDFFLYGSGRGSILCGTLHQNASFGSFDGGGGGGVVPAQNLTLVTDNYSNRSVTVLGVGEIELGVEWARVIGRVRVSAQLAFIGQIWVGGDPSANSIIAIEEGGLFSQGVSNFGFLGGVFRAGVSF